MCVVPKLSVTLAIDMNNVSSHIYTLYSLLCEVVEVLKWLKMTKAFRLF